MESGLFGISKIFLIKAGAEYLQQSFTIKEIEPGNRSDYRNGAKMLNRTFVIFVAMALLGRLRHEVF